MNREPLAIRAAITAAVTALVHVAVVFGLLDLTVAQEALIGGAIDAVGLAVLTVWARGAVTPVADPRIPAEPKTAYVNPYTAPLGSGTASDGKHVRS